MATTIANNDYVIIDNNNIVISSFHGYDLPEYNEEMITVIDVSELSVKPQLNWVYNSNTDKFSEPPTPEVDPVPEPTPLEILKDNLAKEVVADIEYMGTTFQAREGSYNIVTSYLTLIAIHGSLPSNFFWLDKFNNKVPMTEDEFKEFATLFLAGYFEKFSNYVEQRQLLNT